MNKYPKIGIRPTIDGRQGGVRESLEEKTMNLAKSVALLIETNLKNGDGSAVECVIADSTIGRVGESAACAAKFEREGVGSTITVTSSWNYGSETMDMNLTTLRQFGFNGTERPGAVYLAAVLQHTHKKDCLLSVFMVVKYKMLLITAYLTMFKKNYSDLHVLHRL